LLGFSSNAWGVEVPPNATLKNQTVEAIRFSGNIKTQPEIMLQEITLHAGDPFSSEAVAEAKQAIMDLGLFSAVKAHILPGDTGPIVEFEVTEKYYVIPLPTLERTADGEIRYGANLRVDNVAGLNQTVKLAYEAQRGCCTTKRTTHSIDSSYYHPRVGGSHYNLKLSAAHSQIPYTTLDRNGNIYAEHKQLYSRFTVGASRWLTHEHGPSHGWHAGLDLFWRQQNFTQESGPPLTYDNTNAVGLTAIVGYTRVHDHIYSRSGMQYGLVSEHGLEPLGSDNPYTRHQLYYRNYIPLGPVAYHTNLNLQTRMGVSAGQVPISSYAYTLGGSDDIRGYQKNEIKGRSYFVQNIEFLAPLFGHAPARGVLFADFGNAYNNNKMIDIDSIESSYGLGLRYKFKSFVSLQLRVDMSYANGPDRRKFYIGSKSTF